MIFKSIKDKNTRW